MSAIEPADVLIVDDTPDMRLLLGVVLGHYADFRVVAEAGDGRSAIELAGLHRPDLVLLDLAMPQMDGLQALPLIRAAAPGARVVVYSGFDARRMADAALAAGAAAYVQKGASPAELVATLAAVLGRTPSPREGAAAVPGSIRPPPADRDEQANRALARTAHELRNPAIALTMLAEELATSRHSLDETTIERLLDAIVRQAATIDQLTTDLLTSAHARRGSVTVRPEPLPLAPLLASCVAVVDDRLHVELECPDGLVVRADPLRMQQIVTNLLTNAARYGAPPVQVRAAPHGGCARVHVVDHGPGVPEWFRAHLFDEYAQADPDRGTGSGIGLFVVRSVARAQGGDAWYEPYEGGADFCVEVPLNYA